MKIEVEANDPLGVSVLDIVPSCTAPPVRPLHNQVVLKVLRNPERLFPNSMLFLPESANDNKDHGAIGLVVAKGQGHRRKHLAAWLEGYCELPVEVGDYVLFARASGEAHAFGGESYLFTPVEHVWAVLEGYEAKTAPATEREFGLQQSLEKKWGRSASEMPIVRGQHR